MKLSKLSRCKEWKKKLLFAGREEEAAVGREVVVWMILQ